MHAGVVLTVNRVRAGRRRSGEGLFAAAPRYPDVEQAVFVGGDGVVCFVLIDDGQLLTGSDRWGAVNAMFEIRISPLAASAADELGAGSGGISVIEDSPFGLAGAEEGGDSLVPPHAISTATESRSDDIRVTMRIMLCLSRWINKRC